MIALLDSTAAGTSEAPDPTPAGPPGPGLKLAAWLVGRVAVLTARLDHLAEQVAAWREVQKGRAGACWAFDRRAAIEDLGANLPRRPEVVAARLRRTVEGADWLIERWEALARLAESAGAWDVAARSLALDLLGVPTALRAVEPHGLAARPAADQAHFARRQAETLAAFRRDALGPQDARARRAAQAGLAPDAGPEARLLRRDEAACRRELAWALAQLDALRTPSDSPAPAPLPADPPEPLAPPAAPTRPAMAALLRSLGLPPHGPVPDDLLDLDDPASLLALPMAPLANRTRPRSPAGRPAPSDGGAGSPPGA